MSGAPGAPPRPTGLTGPFRILEPLRIRSFRLLWTGLAVSLIGDGIFLVALAWQVYELTNAPTALAWVGVAISIPHVAMLLLGGVASDRLNRRHVMIGADLVRGAAMAALGLLSLGGALRLWHLVALAVPYGAATAFFGPAFDAIVPDLVPSDGLTEANSLDQFVRPAALRLAGPALGGAIVGVWGLGTAFLVDAGTFALSALCMALMGRITAPARSGGSPLRDVAEGFRFVRRHVWLWGTFLVATVAYLLFMGPIEVLLPYVVKNDLRGSAAVLGFVFAMGGLGAIGGALFMGHRGLPRRRITVMYACWASATFAVAGYGLATKPWQVMAVSFAFNGLETVGTVIWATTKHRRVPSALLGRVSSFDWFISIGLVPVSFALTGPVAAAIGPRATLVGAGVIGGMVTLAGLFLPGMRAMDQEPASTRDDVVRATDEALARGDVAVMS